MVTVVGTFGPDDLSGSPELDLILGLGGADRLDGLAGTDLVFGGRGNDTAFGGDGADVVLGGPDDDSISGSGAAADLRALRADGADLLLGEAGNDTIDGWGGRDRIFGGAGDDVLRGGYDADRLTGGPGGDVFAFRLLPSEGAPFATIRDTGVGKGNRDVVTDFRQGEDLLDLSGHRNPAGPGPASVFLGTDEFVGTFALQVRYEVLEDGNTLVQFAGILGRPANVPPDFVPPAPAEPDGEIVLTGVHQLTADNFFLL